MKAKLKSWRLGYVYWPYPAITGAPLLLHMITSCSWILLELLNQMDGTFGLVCQSKWSSVMCDYSSLAKQYLLEWSLKLACSENNSRVVESHNQWNTSSHCQCMEDQSFACCGTKSTWRHNHHATITVMSSHALVWPNHLYKFYPVIFVLYTLVLRSSVEGGPSSGPWVEVCGEECGRPTIRMCMQHESTP